MSNSTRKNDGTDNKSGKTSASARQRVVRGDRRVVAFKTPDGLELPKGGAITPDKDQEGLRLGDGRTLLQAHIDRGISEHIEEGRGTVTKTATDDEYDVADLGGIRTYPGLAVAASKRREMPTVAPVAGIRYREAAKDFSLLREARAAKEVPLPQESERSSHLVVNLASTAGGAGLGGNLAEEVKPATEETKPDEEIDIPDDAEATKVQVMHREKKARQEKIKKSPVAASEEGAEPAQPADEAKPAEEARRFKIIDPATGVEVVPVWTARKKAGHRTVAGHGHRSPSPVVDSTNDTSLRPTDPAPPPTGEQNNAPSTSKPEQPVAHQLSILQLAKQEVASRTWDEGGISSCRGPVVEVPPCTNCFGD